MHIDADIIVGTPEQAFKVTVREEGFDHWIAFVSLHNLGDFIREVTRESFASVLFTVEPADIKVWTNVRLFDGLEPF